MRADEVELAADLESGTDAVFPEMLGELGYPELEDADGYTAYLPMADTEDLALGTADKDNLTFGNLVERIILVEYNFADSPRENPGVKTKKRFFFMRGEDDFVHWREKTPSSSPLRGM